MRASCAATAAKHFRRAGSGIGGMIEVNSVAMSCSDLSRPQ
jgi:hypothetical protein